MAKQKIADVIKQVLTPFLQENGFALFNVEYIKEGKDWFLRVYIDFADESEERYIGIDDCEKVSRYLSMRLDELDLIEKNYYLEVSSPGLDRPLLQDTDFEKYKGRLVDISLYKAKDGSKQISGELIGLAEDTIIILNGKNEKVEIPRKETSKVKLSVVF